ncbi:MAG: M56 family metallopeptidase [Candidatus Eremiobacteraeota bacterium]|nr:M56 family metallopeptidase [Candidatus Eremiobacteraeota bacterium]
MIFEHIRLLALFAVTVLASGLWQGAVIFGAAWVAVRMIPQNNPSTRHVLWLIALAALVVVPLFTNVRQPTQPQNREASAFAVTASAMQATPLQSFPDIGPVHAPAAPSRFPRLISFVVAPMVATWLAAFWLFGALFSLLRLGGSMLCIARLRRRAVCWLNAEFTNVFVSQELPLPVSVGIVRPIILVPQALMEMLATDDLRRIIIHEQAHLRRHDIPVNAVQRSLEALLFFNPWAHLIGRQLVAERESACDARVVSENDGVIPYASCLTKLAQANQYRRAPLAAPGALGSRHSLAIRIERMISSAAGPASR